MEKSESINKEKAEAYTVLEQGVHAALETYSNVHRGSGHNSMVSTYLFEQARDIVLKYLGLKKNKYAVIFCTPRRAAILMAQLEPKWYYSVSSHDIGLPLAVRALAVYRKVLHGGPPFETGGGTASLVSPGWVIWAKAPDKFEAGTPSIINVIAFAKALRMIKQSGKDLFRDPESNEMAATDILYHDHLDEYSGRELLNELRQTLIGRNFPVPTVTGPRPFINLDNGASTPTFSPVWDSVYLTWHQPRHVQQEVIKEVRSICANMLGAPLDSHEVIFTSNTTEAINLAANSFCLESEQGIEPVILNTLLEHSSNELPWRMIPKISLVRLAVDAEGFVDLNEMDALLCAYNEKYQFGRKQIKLVVVSGASNVLGVFNNLQEISRIVHKYGARLLVDAAQLVAHRKVGIERDGIDYLAFSAHKVYAPFGSGVLVVKKGLLKFNPAELELIRSSGEENAGGIAALGKALVLLQRIGMDLIQEEEQGLTARALLGLEKVPGLTVYGIKNPGSPRFTQKGGVIVFALKGIMPDKLAKELAGQGGIGVRYGCHCAHLLIKRLLKVPPLLERIQGLMLTLFPKVRLPGLVRVSLGIENSEDDIDTLLHVLGKIAKQPRPRGNRTVTSPQNEWHVLSKMELHQQMNDFVKAAATRVFSHL